MVNVNNQRGSMAKGIIGAAVVGVGLIGASIFGFGGSSHIPVGSVGIVKHMNGAVTEIPQGWHWTGWTTGVQKYPTYKQSLVLSDKSGEGGTTNGSWKVGTMDQQELPVNTSLTWSISTKDAKALYQAVGGKDIDYIKDSIVSPTMKNIVNQITHQYGWNEIKGSKQAEVSAKINEALKAELIKSGIEVGTFGFTHVGAPAGMEAAQSALATAELGKQQALADQQKAQISNQTAIQNAEAQAKVTEIQAQATKAKAATLNALVIQEQMIAKWNGQLPQVSGSSTIMQLPGLK
jgi:regulator of protease activity HflC (stomatin/prohibitin superfamily)